MKDLREYVEELFRNQRLTPEVKDLKEEILSNMIAKRDDLIAQGMDEDTATMKAKESISAVDYLIDGNQLTDVGKYRLECTQTILLNSIIFWIFSLPLLFTGFRVFSYLGLLLAVGFGVLYLCQRKQSLDSVAFISVTASEKRKKVIWIVWSLFVIVSLGMIAAITFGSNIWFGRPFSLSEPYQMANIASRFYLPLLTVFVPITFGNFTSLLLKNRKECGENE